MKNMVFKRKLPVPKEIKEQYPLTAELAKIKEERDAIIADVFTGKSDKMVLIIVPDLWPGSPGMCQAAGQG